MQSAYDKPSVWPDGPWQNEISIYFTILIGCDREPIHKAHVLS